MGTITSLLERISRARGQSDRCAIVVSAFGFSVGERSVAWQTVHEIWGYRIDLPTEGQAFLEFVVGSDRIVVCEQQPGFVALQAAVCAVFPSTVHWCGSAPQTARAGDRTLLYRLP